MSNNKLDKPKKEYYIKKIKKYNKDLDKENRKINLSCIVTSLVLLYAVWSVFSGGIMFEPPLLYVHIAMIGVSIVSAMVTIRAIAIKTGIKERINEIEELLVQYGFTLDDEISKVKGK